MPNGWYVVAVSGDVRPGRIVQRHYFGRELVIYRTTSGVLRVTDAHCPHMGAHLGRMGRVCGERLRCGFHGFQYDTDGRCVATDYDGATPPAKAQLRQWEAREQNGVVLVWFDAQGRPPAWEVPALDDAGWSSTRWKRYRIATTPQETTENSVDLGHFSQLHGFIDGRVVHPIRTEGPLLTSTYAATRGVPFPSLRVGTVEVQYDVNVWGLGYSQVDLSIPAFKVEGRIWVLPVPVDEEHIDLRLGYAANGSLGRLMRPVTRLITHLFVCHEVDQDLDVWNYKSYIESPPLAKGDGPIGIYRRWVRQFYSTASEVPRLGLARRDMSRGASPGSRTGQATGSGA
jgi:nitrite reductase/ring-hydroxylating ferredoxin subunit